MKDLIFYIIFLFILFFLVFIFFGVAYLTLFERHILSLSQNRLGVIKVSFSGLLQCVFDGIKLFKKELIYPLYTYEFFFFFYLSLFLF